jgi:hypothetical protein
MNQLKLYRTASQSFCMADAIHAEMTTDPGNFSLDEILSK